MRVCVQVPRRRTTWTAEAPAHAHAQRWPVGARAGVRRQGQRRSHLPRHRRRARSYSRRQCGGGMHATPATGTHTPPTRTPKSSPPRHHTHPALAAVGVLQRRTSAGAGAGAPTRAAAAAFLFSRRRRAGREEGGQRALALGRRGRRALGGRGAARHEWVMGEGVGVCDAVLRRAEERALRVRMWKWGDDRDRGDRARARISFFKSVTCGTRAYC